jgi:hypothetical protein
MASNPRLTKIQTQIFNKKYATSRQVVSLRNEKGLETFCEILCHSAEADVAQWSGMMKV